MARKLAIGAVGSLLGVTASSLVLMKSQSETLWESVTMPMIRLLDPEVAHRLSVRLASCGLVPSFATISEDKEILVSTKKLISYYYLFRF